MSLDNVLASIAAFVHAHAAVVSVAAAVVILAMLLGDALDVALYGIKNGWKKLSVNVVFSVLAADPANSTAAGVAALAFLGALGSGASYKDAAVAALTAIGTVNAGYLIGADRQKFAIVAQAIFGSKPAPAA
jgi:hypothetical protein